MLKKTIKFSRFWRKVKLFLLIKNFSKFYKNNEEFFSFVIFVFCFVFLIVVLFFFSWKKTKKTGKVNVFLRCLFRGSLKVRKYDANGQFSEEYQRIKLINFFLKKGVKKEQIFLEYPIFFGHKGQNCLRADLVIKDKELQKIILVIEVKKKSTKKIKQQAIKFQLLPAMSLLNCSSGMYFDGSKDNCCLLQKKNDVLIEKDLSFFKL